MGKNDKNSVNSNKYKHLPLSVVLKLYERWSIRHKFSGMKNLKIVQMAGKSSNVCVDKEKIKSCQVIAAV